MGVWTVAATFKSKSKRESLRPHTELLNQARNGFLLQRRTSFFAAAEG
ncbi:hypothetical protein UFOVP851_18 [uncultured Caudovirales phage]|uniref:Uncharacterized protein n=1 Tax=uncultured Caudovirales phage TaxID=2100421 RepID=A0A6J5PF46_9CAUD|nr:hypothetical protein UFOVP851_18 [uncultured Caudovirales phage]